MGKFCEIQTRNELADYLQIPRSKLSYILFVEKTENCYSTFEIPKKSGGSRAICAPTEDLKGIQVRLAQALWEYQKDVWKEQKIHPNISHGFEKEKSIITNAKIHRNKRYVLNIDLEDFFNSFHFGRIQGFFEKNRYFLLPHEVAVTIAQIACYNGRLPQGAPSSPIITNLICQILDMRLLGLAKRYKLDFSRYADDLTFSTNISTFGDNSENFLTEVSAELQNAGFTINAKKNRLVFKDSRQEVTGLVVNEKISVNKIYCKETRAMAYRLYTTGDFEVDGKPATIRQLEGRFSFIDQIDHYNNIITGGKHNSHCLNGRERDYQAFLFYKYFFSNEQPLIVTEGKTDGRYIRAALKSLYAEYPMLVERNSDGIYKFKISFFKRSKRWKYFYGMSMDGADAMKCIACFYQFKSKNNPNYYVRFRNLCGHSPTNPVFLLFDNETESKRPLGKFISDNSIKGDDKEFLKHHLCLRFIANSNLFLATNPLIDGSGECEIEDLFLPEVLERRINGKSFSREDDYDTSTYYGKDIFSKYVTENYAKIDFCRFRPLLDSLSRTIEEYELEKKNEKEILTSESQMA